MNIGIEYHTSLIYEASTTYGYPVVPQPRLVQVAVCSVDAKVYAPSKPGDIGPNIILFREDTFNTSSRVRRGRLYKAGSSQPHLWHVHPHPLIPIEEEKAVQNDGTIPKTVNAFNSFRLRSYLKEKKIDDPIFLLGTETGFTIWALIDIETSVFGEEVVALKARKSIGALPKVNRDEILNVGGENAIELLEKLEEEIFNAGPESLVDRAREATAAVLSVYLQKHAGIKLGNDLAKLAGEAEKLNLYVVANSARIIARLHTRSKNAVHEIHDPRRLTEQDAEFAVQAVGVILCDLGWGVY